MADRVVMERLRPWLWVAWWGMAVAGVATSLLPAAVAAPLYRGVMDGHFWPFALFSVVGVAAARPGEVWRVLVGMVLIGAGIEVAQLWVPGRACEWVDLRDDGVGVGLGWVVVRVVGLVRTWNAD